MCIYIYSYVIISSRISSSSIIGSLISSVGVVSGAVTTIMDDYSTYLYIYTMRGHGAEAVLNQ